MKVTHTAVAVTNLAESLKFYTEVLGLQEVRRHAPHEGMTLVFLKGEGDAMVELIENVHEPPRRSHEGARLITHIGLEVPDMEAAARMLREKGLAFTRGPIETSGGGKIAFFNDPDGAEIEFVQVGRLQ